MCGQPPLPWRLTNSRLSLYCVLCTLSPESAPPVTCRLATARSVRDVQMNRSHNHWRSIRLAGVYLLLGAIWIFASDQLLLRAFPSIDDRTFVFYQTVKGWLFVSATAGLLLLLSYRSQQV